MEHDGSVFDLRISVDFLKYLLESIMPEFM